VPVDPEVLARARAEQERLAGRVSLADEPGPFSLVAGVDVHYDRADRLAKAAAAVFSLPGLELVEEAVALSPVSFPYVSGYLSFREVPPALEALGRLSRPPQVIICDGQGIAHPRGLGLASHLGLVRGLPTVGAAKSRLVGAFQEPGPRRGEWSPLFYRDQVVGVVLRTRDGVKPLFVSPGHRVSLSGAIRLVMACTAGFRLPEPVRRAHHLASRLV
jgi:deoxyribonuclease V